MERIERIEINTYPYMKTKPVVKRTHHRSIRRQYTRHYPNTIPSDDTRHEALIDLSIPYRRNCLDASKVHDLRPN